MEKTTVFSSLYACKSVENVEKYNFPNIIGSNANKDIKNIRFLATGLQLTDFNWTYIRTQTYTNAHESVVIRVETV